MSSESAIEVRDLVKTYGTGKIAVRALDGVDFDVGRGQFVAIMGPSGSGKSTLLHIMGALETATSGTVRLGDLALDGLDDAGLTRLRREHIGFVFQFFNLLPSLTALENVLLPALIARRQDDAMRDRARAMLDRVGLGTRADHLPAELSGGEQQRVSIARALLLDPELVLADEPTGNLDSRSGSEVLRLLAETAGQDQRTVVMVTHDPRAAAVADYVVFLRDGRFVSEIQGGSGRRIAEAFGELQADLEPALAG
jgi:putative ABC transport system ATP-binding protein